MTYKPNEDSMVKLSCLDGQQSHAGEMSYSEQGNDAEQAVDGHQSEERLIVRLEGYHSGLLLFFTQLILEEADLTGG